MRPSDAPARLTLVIGDDELLVSRAVARVVEAVRAGDADADVVDVVAGDLEPAGLDELCSPSLFASRRVVTLRAAQDAGKELTAALLSYAAAPAPDISLVVVHPGGAKGKALVDGLRAADARVVECAAPKWPEDREKFVLAEIQAAGGTTTREAAAALLAAVGTDLRELANACAQLVADSGGTVDEEVVARYHTGRADTSSFTIADRAVEGDAAGALQLARWALSVGQSAAGMTAALAVNLRAIAVVATAGRGSSPQSLAGQLGMPVWKVRKAQGWSRGWRPDGLAVATRAVAVADADVKGAAADPAYAVERAVLAVAAARGGR